MKSRTTRPSEFDAAMMSLRDGDLEGAKRILQTFIDTKKMSADPEDEAACIVARSKIEMLSVQAALRKPVQVQDRSLLARGYLRAARVSYLRRNSRSRQRKQIAAYRASFFSEALKWYAFIVLGETPLTVPLLAKAHRYFAKAIEYAEKADSLMPWHFPADHFYYLDYWQGVVAKRLHLLRYMKSDRDDDVELRLAQQALQCALNAAEQLCETKGEKSIFPNFYYSLDELKIEKYFLDAAKAFKKRQWKDCIGFLERWQKECPAECVSSWRADNVNLRLLSAKVIDAISTGKQQELLQLSDAVSDFSQSHPVGSAAYYFADEVLALHVKANTPLFDGIVDSLAQYFPLDSVIDNYQRKPHFDLFASLPDRIHHCLESHSPSLFR